MRFIKFLTESLKFVDLPELNKKFKDRYKFSLTDCNAKLLPNGGEVKLTEGDLVINDLDPDEIKQFFYVNGWEDCSRESGEFIFRQAREAVDNIKPYYDIDLAKNKEKVSLYKDLCKKLKFKFYHTGSVAPEKLFQTGGLRCKNNNNTRYSNRIYMISGKMALKSLILSDLIDNDMDLSEIQELLDEKTFDAAEQMVYDIKITWENDHDTTDIPKLYMYEINLPDNWPVYKDPEFDDDDEFSACACFTNQNIPVKFLKFIKEV